MKDDKAQVDFYKTGAAISKELREDESLKVYTDEGQNIEVSIVKLSNNKSSNERKIMDYVKDNKTQPADKRFLYVYNGFDTNAKLVMPSAITLRKTKNVLTANNITLIN